MFSLARGAAAIYGAARPVMRLQPLAPLALPQLPRMLVGSAPAPVMPFRGFKVRTSVKKFCKDCYMVRRKGRVYVYCKSNGKHKQRQG